MSSSTAPQRQRPDTRRPDSFGAALSLRLSNLMLNPPRGDARGGKPFSRGALYNILSNPIYLGEIRHKGERHPGQQEAIIDRQQSVGHEDYNYELGQRRATSVAGYLVGS